jgi:hypothetical protein
MAACEEADPRVAWMNERVTVGLKMKGDRFVKMATSEVDGPPVRDFLDNPDCQRIFFVDGAKECVSYPLPPANTKKKVMYLLKPWGEGKALTKDNMDQLVCGDMSPKLMENMFSVFQDVYLPILSNPKNQEARHATPYTPLAPCTPCAPPAAAAQPCSRRPPSDRARALAGLARGDEPRGSRALPPHDRPRLRRPRPVPGEDSPAAAAQRHAGEAFLPSPPLPSPPLPSPGG